MIGVLCAVDGTILIKDMQTSQNWELEPNQAELAAEQCENVSTSHAMIIIDHRAGQLRYGGSRADFALMTKQLRAAISYSKETPRG